MQIQVNMETQYMRREQAVAEAHRGTAITLTFLARAVLSFSAEAITLKVRMRACSFSTTTMVVPAATFRSVRYWSHFDVTTKYASKTRTKALKLLEDDVN